MNTPQAGFSVRGRNPDVLTCIANLSNDEVFTPPAVANKMLDTVADAWAQNNNGASIWANPDLKFLDPFTKSGVFLREITSRLTEGLKAEMPDLQGRVDHILTKQVYGIAITNLTSLLARRSLYCSKFANGEHSIATSFAATAGNIRFERVEHTWVGATEFTTSTDPHTGKKSRHGVNGKCKFCGASQKSLDRGDNLETHAYDLIHTTDIKARVGELFGDDMQFDVIIGNPPYQLNTDGFGTQARPIYQQFVQQAKTLDPRLLCMITPARWFSGGMGLDEFRESMLTDNRLSVIDDYLNASDVFPGIGLKGGVCSFLWDRDNSGPCRVTTRFKDESPSTVSRALLEDGLDVFIRFNEGISILRKVAKVENGTGASLELPEERRFMKLVSAIGAFGLDSSFKGKEKGTGNDLKVYRNGGVGFVERSEITKEVAAFDKWKVFIGRAAPGTGNKDTYPHRIVSTPFLGEPGSISSWTYMYIGQFDTKVEAESVLSYLSCRLTRFLILLHKPSADTTRKVYSFVPTQEWTKRWTDDDLYEKYGLTTEEITFIEKLIRPLDVALTAVAE